MHTIILSALFEKLYRARLFLKLILQAYIKNNKMTSLDIFNSSFSFFNFWYEYQLKESQTGNPDIEFERCVTTP